MNVQGRFLEMVKTKFGRSRFLGRTISFEDSGITWKGDGLHVTAFTSQSPKDLSASSAELSGEGGMTGIKTPGVKRGEDDTVVQIPLSKALAKSYRGLAALANFSTGAKTEKADKCQPFHSFISSRHFPEGFIVAPFKRALI